MIREKTPNPYATIIGKSENGNVGIYTGYRVDDINKMYQRYDGSISGGTGNPPSWQSHQNINNHIRYESPAASISTLRNTPSEYIIPSEEPKVKTLADYLIEIAQSINERNKDGKQSY